MFFHEMGERETLTQAQPKERKSKTSHTSNHWRTERRSRNDERIGLDCSVYTHFPRKVCAVEFGVILSGLHWNV